MPTWHSFDEFGREIASFERDMKAVAHGSTRAMAQAAQVIAGQEIEDDLGADRKFTNWAPTAETKVRSSGSASVLLPANRGAAGVITTANQGRNRGDVGLFAGPGINRRTGVTSRTRAGNLRKVRTFRDKRWNGMTAPMYTADRAVDRMERELPILAQRLAGVATRRHFDVT